MNIASEIKKLPESREILKSYENGEYIDAVLKCRIYLESWLTEYIFSILYPIKSKASKEGRKFVTERFNDMYMQLTWLLQKEHIDKVDYENLNDIRKFCDKVFRAGDVFKVVNADQLAKFLELSMHYCGKLRVLTRQTIASAASLG
jgi:hypothetical protein